ncbi:hypothetical protein CYMTET_51236, partial [Cymbomonas tetramitiformis]
MDDLEWQIFMAEKRDAALRKRPSSGACGISTDRLDVEFEDLESSGVELRAERDSLRADRLSIEFASEGSEELGLGELFAKGNWQDVVGMEIVTAFYSAPHDDLRDKQRELRVHVLASSLYGLYTSAVYFTPIFGGFLADRNFGRTKMIYAGILLIGFGHFVMVWRQLTFVALLFIVVGTGCFKPNISTQLGHLYDNSSAALRD